jgi:hypothetical protein
MTELIGVDWANVGGTQGSRHYTRAWNGFLRLLKTSWMDHEKL